MTLLSWLIVIVPITLIMCSAWHSRRYVRDISDYLASGRVAGRYVLSVGDMECGLSAILLVAMCEQYYQVGMGMGFWGALITPIGLFMSLSGYCVYRFRQTRCLSAGQFLEMRYSRSFRIIACSVRTMAEMVTNAIAPAVAVRFFIYFLGLRPHIDIFGVSIPTYALLVTTVLIMALVLVLPAGRISLLITDCFQGIISYPIFVIFTVFVLLNVSWFKDVAPVMLDRKPGESFLNPMDIASMRDFNLFALMVNIMSSVLNRAAWIGNDTSTSARTPHEQKMAGILGTWRNGFSQTMLTLIALFVVTMMTAGHFASKAHDVRIKLVDSVAQEVVQNPETRGKIHDAVSQIAVARHQIGVDEPYARTRDDKPWPHQSENPDTPFFNSVHEAIRADAPDTGAGNALFQQFKTLYGQMMMPVLLGTLFSPVLMGLFTLLMLMLLFSADASRTFNAAATIIQDIVLPLRKRPMDVTSHIRLLKLGTVGVTVFFFVVSLFFAQLDYINMFTQIMTGVWLGAAGPIMVGGLYTRFGTTAGAWSALAFGSGIPMTGLLIQRNWAGHVYPFLAHHHWVEPIGNFLAAVSRPFNPLIVWNMNPVKFPINSPEIMFMAMSSGVIAYCVVSRLTLKTPFNLDRMLHRGAYAQASDIAVVKQVVSVRGTIKRLVGIDREYTKGDKIIAWSVFCWSLVYSFGILFCGAIIWNAISPWPPERWGIYFFITTIVASIAVGSVSTVWFMIGGIKDSIRLMRDLEARIANPLDNGRVEGHVSTVDAARFAQIEKQLNHDETEEKVAT